jgi:predicted ATPase
MVAEMLLVDQAGAAELTEVIAPHTGGNPYDTAELLNALRRDGLLATTAGGAEWDVAVLRAHLGASEVAGLIAGRIEVLRAKSRAALEAMACLGGSAELGLLQVATGEPASVLDLALAPALEEGLLVAEPGAHQAVRFRHDRLREATLSGLDPRRRYPARRGCRRAVTPRGRTGCEKRSPRPRRI